MVTEPISWQPMNSSQVFISMNSTFISFLQIVTNVKELGVFEIVSKLPIFAICSSKSCKPIVSNTYRRSELSLAAIFKDSFVEYSKLVNNLTWSMACIRGWKDLSIMQKYNFYVPYCTLMNT